MVNPVAPRTASPYGVGSSSTVSQPIHDLIRKGAEESVRQETRKSEASSSLSNTSIRFVPRPELGLVQTRIVDRSGQNVIKAIPTEEHLKFIMAFDKTLAEALGRKLDIHA